MEKPAYVLFLEAVYTEESVNSFLRLLAALQTTNYYKQFSEEAVVVFILQNKKFIALLEKK